MRKLLTLNCIIFSIVFSSFSQNPSSKELEKIDSLLNSIYISSEPGGLVAISKNGKIIYEKPFGLANVELNVSNTSQNVIQIGSITKQFTAIAILKLYQDGVLDINDRINLYLDDIPEIWETITIKQLLSHTSGMIDLFEIPEWMATWNSELSPNELMAFPKEKELLFLPGEDHHYSNAGYGILGMIIEKTSGITWDKFIKQHIFEPLEMNNSDVLEDLIIIPNRANGYQVTSNGFLNPPYLNPSHYYAAGSILTSSLEMVKWNNGLVDGLIINDTLLQMAITNFELNDGTYAGYGYGFVIGNKFDQKIVEHGGSTIGTNSHDLWFPKDSLYIIVLNNSIAFPGSNVKEKFDSRKIAHLLADICFHKNIERPKIKTLTAEQFQEYKGVYHDSKGKPRNIYNVGDRFFWTNSKGRKFEIYFVGDDKFIFENDTKLAFKRVSEKIEEAILTIGDEDYYYTITDLPLPKPKARKTIGKEQYDNIIGKYTVGVVFKVNIKKGENELVVEVTGQDPSVFYLEDGLKFFKSDEEQITITFTESKNGEIDGFIIDFVENQMKGKKKG